MINILGIMYRALCIAYDILCINQVLRIMCYVYQLCTVSSVSHLAYDKLRIMHRAEFCY